MFLKAFAAAVVAVSVAQAAQATTLLCDLNAGRSQMGWISQDYVFEYDFASGKASAYDNVTECTNCGAVPAVLGGSEDKKVSLSWNVLGKDIKGQQFKMQYRASWFPIQNKVIVRATPGAGFRGGFEARGTCKVKA